MNNLVNSASIAQTTTPTRRAWWNLNFQLQISERRLLIMAGDAIALLVAVMIALYVWSLTANEPFNEDFILWRLVWIFLLPLSWFILADINSYFDLRIASNLRISLSRLTRIHFQLLAVYLVIFFFAARDLLPRLFILNYSIVGFVLLLIWRSWQANFLSWTGFRRRAVIVGAGRSAETIVQLIAQHASDNYELVGFICEPTDESQSVSELPALGQGTDLPQVCHYYAIAELIITYGSELSGRMLQGLMTAYEQGVQIVYMPLLYEQITGRVPVEHIGQQNWSIIMPIDGQPISRRLYHLLKRLIDIIFSAIGLLIFGLILPIVAVLIVLDTRGPVFYAQERVGRNGKIFKVFKLRTMRRDAERESGPRWATERDPRVTRIGWLLRKTRLDEMPQFLNVLIGQMSMVGPRPERPMFVAQLTEHIPFYRTRLVVKPGITGWAQVCYTYGSSVEDALTKLQYDLYYIRHQSLLLDLQILTRTVAKVLTFQGR